MKLDENQFALDVGIVMAIATALGFTLPKPEELKTEEEKLLLIAFYAIYQLKKALNGKEDAEFILYLWNQAEEKIKQLNS